MSDIKCSVVSMENIQSNEGAAENFHQLTLSQWDEVDHRRKTSDLNLDYDKYIMMGNAGMHFIVLAHTDIDLIGYLSIFIVESLHTREITALTDTIFIKKEYRKGGLGSDMIAKAEAECKARGAKNFMVTFKNDSPHPEIVKQSGFFSYETIYAKYIGD